MSEETERPMRRVGLDDFWKDPNLSFPHSPEMESAALACILYAGCDPLALSGDDFASDTRRIIWESAVKFGCSTERNAERVEWVCEQARIPIWGMLEAEKPYYGDLDAIPDMYTAYVDILKRLTTKRQMRYISAKLLGMAADGADSAPAFAHGIAQWLRKQADLMEAATEGAEGIDPIAWEALGRKMDESDFMDEHLGTGKRSRKYLSSTVRPEV